ncbi:hypothetical protein KC323_g9329 [Hortaea werneckii]|nr:hypothetical protein KC323_g9329 [Hortaea werneckii]
MDKAQPSPAQPVAAQPVAAQPVAAQPVAAQRSPGRQALQLGETPRPIKDETAETATHSSVGAFNPRSGRRALALIPANVGISRPSMNVTRPWCDPQTGMTLPTTPPCTGVFVPQTPSNHTLPTAPPTRPATRPRRKPQATRPKKQSSRSNASTGRPKTLKKDLICHRIPTDIQARPTVAKLPPFTHEEEEFQRQKVPDLLEANIFVRVRSVWAART